jgi:hypothetical protein
MCAEITIVRPLNLVDLCGDNPVKMGVPTDDQVVICTPDKDLGQCIVGTRVVQLDRRRGVVRDEAGAVG